MTAGRAFATRTFVDADQGRFAALSGDVNPMHMDSIAARRTVVGAPVVHGIHTLLWALDEVARQLTFAVGVKTLQVRFGKPVYVGDTVTLSVGSRTASDVTIKVLVEGAVTATLKLGLDQDSMGQSAPRNLFDGPVHPADDPADLVMGDVAGRTGTIRFAADLVPFHESFPGASALVGAHRLRGLAALSRLVGMECPGVHSLFASIRVELTDEDDREVDYGVGSVDPRYRLVEMSVAGAGLTGRVKAFLRPEPTRQLSAVTAAAHVAKGSYAGHHALIVGGSRGLGELAAKLVAAGGGSVTITYVVGEHDAVAVAAEIEAAGGSAAARRYDATAPAAPQLAGLAEVTHVYYFATQRITGRLSGLAKPVAFDPSSFEAYTRIYVTGFHDLVAAVTQYSGEELRVFYPSTVFIDEGPRELGEYAAAKAAGEAVCAHITRHNAGITVIARRLPRMLTDQTASVTPLWTTPAIDVMRPLVDHVQLGGSEPAPV